MATDADEFGRVSRLRGVLFETLTRAASAVGVIALFALLTYSFLDAVQPFTAEPAWYLVLAGTFGVPALIVGAYCWRNRAVARVSLRAMGAVLAGTGLASVLVLWLGGQLALLVLVTTVLPTGAFVGYLAGRRRALTVGFQTVGIVVVGGGIASLGAMVFGAQTTLVFAVGLGLPAAMLARFFLPRPDVGSVGANAAGVSLLAVGTAFVGVEAITGVAGISLGESAVGVYALAAVVGALIYGAYAYTHDRRGLVGLFAPFVLVSGVLAGYLFHRTFVVTAPVVPLLFGLTVLIPAGMFASRVLQTAEEGRLGLAVPVVAAAGMAGAVLFDAQYVVRAPTDLLAFLLAIGVALGGYGWVLVDRERGGVGGLLTPVILGGGLLAGLLGADQVGIAGPETWLTFDFLTGGSHYEAALAGIHPALVGSLYLMFIVAFVAFPVGVGAAIYLEEYAANNRWTRLLEINIANLAGVPSVVYGLLGVGVFLRYGGLTKGAVLAGGLTLSLLILPIVIVSSQEAIRAVPDSLRQASYGMGATQWQTIRNVVLPRAVPGILTGTILALGRAVGETAPLLMVGLAAVSGVPSSLTGQGTAMPLQVFSWAKDPNLLFRENVAAAGSVTLLVTMLAMNGVAIIIRNKYQREQ